MRSYQLFDKPMALEISEHYEGGGHLCAAGCSLPKNLFKQQFKLQGNLKPSVTLTKEEIENILFDKKL